MIINIINLAHRVDRRNSAIEQMNSQGAAYMFWNGIITKERRIGIGLAHKQVVRYAQESNLPMVAIAEDDIKFTHPRSLRYFLDNIPNDFDIYTSGFYTGHMDADYTVHKFTGLTLYIVHSRFYDKFLSAPEHHHIDVGIHLMEGVFKCCPKMCAVQISGYSDQRRSFVDDSTRLKDKQMYNGD